MKTIEEGEKSKRVKILFLNIKCFLGGYFFLQYNFSDTHIKLYFESKVYFVYSYSVLVTKNHDIHPRNWNIMNRTDQRGKISLLECIRWVVYFQLLYVRNYHKVFYLSLRVRNVRSMVGYVYNRYTCCM